MKCRRARKGHAEISTSNYVVSATQQAGEKYTVVSNLDSKQGSVYFARIEGLIKIGFTANLKRRLYELNREYPGGAQLLCVVPNVRGHVEKQFHKRFAHLLERDFEWFRPDMEIILFIDRMKDQGLAE